MWKRLDHPNIVPLLGVTASPLQLVSVWMTGGELPEYVNAHPHADRLGLVSICSAPMGTVLTARQLSDAADGLSYLHSHGIIHGDLKGVRKTECSRSLLIRASAKHSRG